MSHAGARIVLMSPNPATNSLRSSCDHCAASKIGCTKEKPACARCTKRGLPCQYSPIKRPGRPLQNSRLGESNTRRRRRSVELFPASPTRPASPPITDDQHDNCQSPTSEQIAAVLSTNSASASDSSLSDFIETPSRSAQPLSDLEFAETYQIGLNDAVIGMDFDMRPEDIWGMDMTDTGVHLPQATEKIWPDGGLNTIHFDPSSLELVARTSPASTRSGLNQNNTLASNSASPNAIPGERSELLSDAETWSLQSCSCSSVAMALMTRQLSGLDIQSDSNGPSANFRAILDGARDQINDISNILQCSCKLDVYLTVILTMITFRILDRLDTAASLHDLQEPGSVSSAAGSSLDLEDTNEQLLAAQSILSRLHGVQALINSLSGRIHVLRDACQTKGGNEAFPKFVKSPASGTLTEFESPLPQFEFFNKLEADMLTRKRSLAKTIIGRL